MVTGAAGLIGMELCYALLQTEAEQVIAIDPRGQQLATLLPGECSRFRLISTDVRDPQALEVLGKASTIFHLAASTAMRWSAEHPRRDLDGGFELTFSVLEALRTRPGTKLIFCSSSAVYGMRAAALVAEDEGPILPCSAYGASKLASEAWISAYSQLFGLHAVICRLGNIVSASQDRGVVLDIVRQVASSHVVRPLGNALQARTYLQAFHCAQALIHLAALAQSPPLVVNVSGRGLVSTSDLIDIVREAVGRSVLVEPSSSVPAGWAGDVPIVHLDVSRLENLGWLPPSSYDEVREAVADLVRRFNSGAPHE